MPDQPTSPPSDDPSIAEWAGQGRRLLEVFEEQARSHQELADGYRAQAHRLRQMLDLRGSPPDA